MSGLNSKNLRVPKTVKLFIGGDFPRTESGRSFPANVHGTGELYAHLCLSSRKDLRNAVTAAQTALSGWESRSAYNRSQILYRMAEMAEGKRAEFIDVLIATLGYSTNQAEKSVDEAIDAFIYFAGWADKYQQILGAVNPVSGPHHNFTTPEAVGVVALIADEKFDLGKLVSQIAAIIVSGNSLVVLLSEEGAAVLAPLAETFATSDLPKGVVNLLTGRLSELYSHFGMHMEIQSLSYQGSDSKIRKELTEMGIANMKRMGNRVEKPLSLEHLTQYIEFKTVWHPIGV